VFIIRHNIIPKWNDTGEKRKARLSEPSSSMPLFDVKKRGGVFWGGGGGGGGGVVFVTMFDYDLTHESPSQGAGKPALLRN